jgi:hypothetical protein
MLVLIPADMVVKVVEATDIGDKVMPSPSDVYSDFLDQKNGVTWDPSILKWKLVHTERGFTLCNLTPMDNMVSTLITMRIDGRVNMMWCTDTRARCVSRDTVIRGGLRTPPHHVRQQHPHSSPTSSRRGREGRRRTTRRKLGSTARRGGS